MNSNTRSNDRRSAARRFLDGLLGYRVFTCSRPDCELQIRVRGMDAAETRAWQELTADHDRHSRLHPRNIH